MAQATDKARLSEFVGAAGKGVLKGWSDIEAEFPDWEIGAGDVILRGSIKPDPNGGEPWFDVDEGTKVERSEIPIRLRRKA